MSGLTAALADFVAADSEIPLAAQQAALTGVIDAVGTLLAGRHAPVVSALVATLGQPVAEGRSGVLLTRVRVRAHDAAMINATAAHALAMDDVAHGCHPSAVLMPALLAVAEAQGCSGAAILRAYVVGYQVLAELAGREPDPLHHGAWHPSGVLMPVAVAAAVAHLKRLPVAACAHALAIAASMSGGLIANFGTPTKALHAGRASSAGVLAAELAGQGVFGASDALESSRGLLAAISPKGRADRTDTGLVGDAGRDGQAWAILQQGLCIKQYPLCYSTHRVVDAAIDLAGTPALDLARIEGIEVEIGAAQAAMARHHRPIDELQARYSVEFAAVAGLVAGAAGFEQLMPAFIGSELVQGLIARTTLSLRDGHSDDDPVFCPADRLRVRLADGRVLDSGEVTHARGHWRRPIGRTEARQKFIDCAVRGGRNDATTLYECLLGLPEMAVFDGSALVEPEK